MNTNNFSQLYIKETAFQDLMQRRILNVLLIASPYDAFMMEEDGRVEEQLFFEYMGLNLSSPPRVTRVSTLKHALEVLAEKKFDLVISMPGNDVSDTLADARVIRRDYPDLPLVLLTPFSKEVSRRLSNEDLSGIDYVFSWLGNVDLLLGIIKLLEDKMNAEFDINNVGVQVIMLVEDSVRFYSSVMPILYKFLLKQSREFSTEALNEHEQMLRMRGRPKVVLARDFEEAQELYNRFGRNMLGVITDVSFKRGGEKDAQAGLRLTEWLKSKDSSLPVIIESSEVANREPVAKLGCTFIDKNSKKLPVDLGEAIMSNFGFGDFVLRDPSTGLEVARIRSLKEMQYHIFDIPAESLFFHARSNDISRWLYSRALFPIANAIRHHHCTSIDDLPAARQLFFDLIVKYRKMKNRGVVAVFRKDRFDHYSNFARIGEGSLGGKGRGLAFIDSIIKKNAECDNFKGITISIPRTVVLCTDIFDEFMRENRLYPIALSDAPDSEILDAFLKAHLPIRLRDDFMALFEVVDRPLAIRSSSLLEDSHYQPFAGIYSTYMIPQVKDREVMIEMLADAIKGVYASVFFHDSKAYMTATSNVIDQEKMAVIIQEVVGEDHQGFYYPSFSGVGRSLNYYPIGDEAVEDGVAEVAVGLGKYIVDGGKALRFSPRHPKKVLQTSELNIALRDTQTTLYGIDLNNFNASVTPDDSFNLTKMSVQEAAKTGALRNLVSLYDFRDNVLRDFDDGQSAGRRVVTFNNVLKHGVFPLAEAVDFMLTIGQKAMCRPIEIEFAGIMAKKSSETDNGHIYWLQIRPIIDRKELVDDNLLDAPDADAILKSTTALGHGHIEGIRTVVYVRPQNFDSMHNPDLGEEIDRLNREYCDKGEGYILIGPGRWGSSDSALGIPVKWPAISGAKLIVESTLPGYRIEPSQGTHFFHNLTSMGVGYLTIDSEAPGGGFIDTDWLDAQPAVYESERLRAVSFPESLEIGLNGLKGVGVVLKPTPVIPSQISE